MLLRAPTRCPRVGLLVRNPEAVPFHWSNARPPLDPGSRVDRKGSGRRGLSPTLVLEVAPLPRRSHHVVPDAITIEQGQRDANGLHEGCCRAAPVSRSPPPWGDALARCVTR